MDTSIVLDLLGQQSADSFMKHYWQRKPLLIRNAIKNFRPPVNWTDLKNLAKRDDVESRMIWQEKGQWNLKKGPFKKFPTNKTPNWSFLVQSVDLQSDEIADLMQQFRFIPDARLDDVMISYASKGGGVGPHFDSYDVFLLQGMGQRTWRISQQKDLTLIPDLPCKILQNFVVEEELVLNPGDMLYLPPHVAHDGIALTDDCMTISIGFRTPSIATLVRGVLEAAADQISARSGMGPGIYGEPLLKGSDLTQMYKDKAQKATSTPAKIPELMIKASIEALKKVQFTPELVARFLGCWLSEPNQLAVFNIAEDELDWEDFKPTGKLRLDRKSRMMYYAKELFINGEALAVNHKLLQTLANQREVSISQTLRAPESIKDLLLQWIDDGYLHYVED